MKHLWYFLFICAVPVLWSCEIRKTEDGKLPVIELEEGKLPEYEVDFMDVDVGTRMETVRVPEIKVVMVEQQVKVPYIDLQMPAEGGSGPSSERKIEVEMQVEEEFYRLDIERVYAAGNRLIVVSSLEPTGQPLGDESVRIEDHVILRAPDMDEEYYIVGQKPAGRVPGNYIFVDSPAELKEELQGAKLVYKD